MYLPGVLFRDLLPGKVGLLKRTPPGAAPAGEPGIRRNKGIAGVTLDGKRPAFRQAPGLDFGFLGRLIEVQPGTARASQPRAISNRPLAGRTVQVLAKQLAIGN
jgi:hypothetical protein